MRWIPRLPAFSTNRKAPGQRAGTDHVHVVSPGANYLCCVALSPRRVGFVEHQASAGARPLIYRTPGPQAKNAARSAAASGPGILGPDLREIRAGIVHPARPDPPGRGTGTGPAARPRAAVSLGSGGRVRAGRPGGIASYAVPVIRSEERLVGNEGVGT